MTAPVIRQFLGTIPDKGQAQTAFDTNVDAFLDWQALQFAPDLVAFGTFASSTAAALVAANLPSLTGNELDAVRVNAAADGVEFVDVTAAGWTFLAAADTAAQKTLLGIEPSFQIGDTITSARALASPEWLPSDGAVYLQSSYPALFAELGIVGVFNPGLKLSDPAALPANIGFGTAFSADGTYLSVAHVASPFVTIYKRSGDVFTKLANPAALPAGTGNGTAFSPDGTYLSVAHQSSPFVTIYKRSGDVFTKLANPAALPANHGFGTAFSADGTYLSVAHFTSPFVTIYKRSGDVFTKLANPAALPPNTGNGTAFSADGTYLSVAHQSSPFVTIYKRSGDVFTKLTNPAALPANIGNGTAFSTDGTYLSVAHQSSPFLTIYKSTTYDKATSFAVTNSPDVGLFLKTFIKAT